MNPGAFPIICMDNIFSPTVFASQFCTKEQALEYFQEYNSDYDPYQESEPRLLEWISGFLENPWQGNIVALGLTSGFIEPLESNALYMIQYSITNLVKTIKNQSEPIYKSSTNRKSA